MTDTQFDADAILAKFEFAEREISRLEVLIENEISAGSVHKLRRIGQKADWFLQDMRSSYFHLDDTTEESYYKRLVACEDKILDLWTKLDAQFCNLEETKNTINNSNSDQLKSNLRLPKIELKIFDGEKTSWLSYKEMFLNSIDKNDKLTDQEKCSYLFSSLKAQPLKLISGFPISAASYKEAWNSLLNRYDNKRQLSHALLAKFLNVKPIKTCTQKAILELLDTCNESIRNLKTLNYEFNDFVNLILVDLIQNKLEDSLRKEWELSLEGDTIPTYDSLILFLEKYAKSLQGINEGSSRNESKSTFKPEFKSYSGKRSVANAAIADLRCKSIKNCCPACKNEHLLYQCPELQKMSLDQRWDLVKKKRLCSNCLRGNHFQSRCVISSNCKICEQRHHTALHRDKTVNCNSNALPQSTQASTLTEYTPNVHAPEFQSVTAHMVKENHRTLLSTATVHIETCFGQKIACKALLDSGSQKSLVSQAFSKKLGLPIRNTKHRLSGINNLTAETALKEMSLKVSPYFNKETFAIDVLVVNQITTNLPNFVFKTQKWPHLAGLQLADPNYQQSSPIDLLIGADVYTELVLGETILGPKGSPNALKSKLGWLLSGVIYAEPQEQNITCHMLTQLETNIQKFWELEAVPQPNLTPSVDDTYSKTVARTSEGRYIVTLPFKSPPDLGNTETQALKRLQYLETKLAKNPALKSEYSAFMEDYLKAGHMELVPDSETSDPTKIYYLPHHSVLREESVSTRLRVVFDASAKGSKGKSLNDFLEIGPKLQPDILNLLVKF